MEGGKLDVYRDCDDQTIDPVVSSSFSCSMKRDLRSYCYLSGSCITCEIVLSTSVSRIEKYQQLLVKELAKYVSMSLGMLLLFSIYELVNSCNAQCSSGGDLIQTLHDRTMACIQVYNTGAGLDATGFANGIIAINFT